MIKTTHLAQYPRPETFDSALEHLYKNEIENKYGSKGCRNIARARVKLFSIFLDVTNRKLRLLDLKCSQELLIRSFIGFIHTEVDLKLTSKYQTSTSFLTLLTHIYNELGLTPPPYTYPHLNKSRITNDVEQCIIEYREGAICQVSLEFYAGWYVRCKNGELIFLNLARFTLFYGISNGNQVFESMKRYAATKNMNTLRGEITVFIKLLKFIMKLCPTLEEYKFAIKPKHINCFVEQLFSYWKLEIKSQNYSMRNFYRDTWLKALVLINKIFIASKIWVEPPYEMFSPTWKSSSMSGQRNIVKDQVGNAFNNKLVTHIPLSYSDDETIKAILVSIERDVNHVSIACKKEVDRTMTAFWQRKKLMKSGRVKKIIPVGHANAQVIDMKDLANQAATWEYHRWSYPKLGFAKFLGTNNTRNFCTKLGLLGPSYTLTPFVLLLIEQHPCITQSWIINFELFDNNGKLKGFRQTGELWIAESVKKRKGNQFAQQIITLNAISKKLIENIISYTNDAREWLKEQGNDDWRYLLLSSTGLCEPERVKVISNPTLKFHDKTLTWSSKFSHPS